MINTNSLWAKVQRKLLFTFARFLPDRFYLEKLFPLMVGYSLDLDNPQTFNEKLQWLKLYDRKPEYSKMVDKYEVKEFVANRIGKNHVIPMIGVYDSPYDIFFKDLPNKFIMKCTHNSGGNVICKNLNEINIDETQTLFHKLLKKNYFWRNREWPYKDVKPKVLVDTLLCDLSSSDLMDYKFWCFDGKPVYMYVTVKNSDIFENFYDMSFNPVNINHGYRRRKPEFSKPESFDQMKKMAADLSKGIPFVRVDFFFVNGIVYFGEFTFYDWAGFQSFESYEQDLELGKLIEIPSK